MTDFIEAPCELPILSSTDVHLWRIALSDTHHLKPAFDDLDEDEQARAQRFYFPRHRRRFILAHAALRRILSRYLKCPAKTIVWDYQEHGKPNVCPQQNPLKLEFNLSHSHDIALLAVTIEHPIGIDVEIMKDRDCHALSQRYFSPDEHKAWLSIPKDQQLHSFFHIWTQKEAVIKALGLGLAYPLDAFTVSASPPANLQHIASDQATHWSMHDFSPHPDYCAAIAIRCPIEKVRMMYWTYQWS